MLMHDTKDVLLTRDDVGRSKPSTYDLPPSSFIYGKSAGHDEEGASEGIVMKIARVVTRSWKFHSNSKDVVPEKDFKRINALAARKKHEKSKDATKAHKEAAGIRLKPHKGTKGVEIAIPDANFSYGMPTKPPTPIKDVICNYYGEKAEKETIRRYEEISKLPEEKLRSPRQTQASKKMAATVRDKTKDKTERRDLFKMKRFLGVSPRTDTHVRHNKSVSPQKEKAAEVPKPKQASPAPVPVPAPAAAAETKKVQ